MRALLLIAAAVYLQPSLAFETCTPANSYLERLLPDVIDEPVDPLLPIECVTASHLSLAPSGYYGFCPTSVGMPARTHPRPCVSRKYVGTIHSALINVADCLSFDPRLAFATFNLESAMHMVAVGAATDVGVGQLTKSAIDEVTLNALDRARRTVAVSDKPSCRKILPYMTAHASEREKRCGFMSVPENPMRNLIYSILLMQQNRKAIDRYWTRLNVQLPAWVDTEFVKERLTLLAYNAGTAGGVATLKAYIDLMGEARLNERLLNFESKDFYSFPRFMGLFFPVPAGKESTRKRVSKYVFYVAQAARRVERLAGVMCFDPFMFPLPDPSTPVVFEGGKPDFPRAARIARNYLRSLAQDFARAHHGEDCESARARFLHEFLPVNSTAEDLGPDLMRIYSRLCAR